MSHDKYDWDQIMKMSTSINLTTDQIWVVLTNDTPTPGFCEFFFNFLLRCYEGKGFVQRIKKLFIKFTCNQTKDHGLQSYRYGSKRLM